MLVHEGADANGETHFRTRNNLGATRDLLHRCNFSIYFASAIFVVLAASPLSTIRTVLAERNSASIYAPLTAAQCANQPAPNLPTPTPMPKPKA